MTVSLNENAICTRDEVKDFLNVVGVNNDVDDLINQVINRMSDAFESYCGRVFHSQEFTEYYDGGISFLFPKNTPITAITSIHEDSDWLFTSSAIDSTTYRIINDNHVYYNGYFETGVDSVKIVYTGGYSTLPDDLIQACITEVSRIIKHRVDFDVLTVTRDDGSVTYNNLDYLPLTQKALDHYRPSYTL